MTSINAFLLDRIAEDEAAARAVAPPQMSGYRGDVPDQLSVSRRRERGEDGYPFVVADPESTALLGRFNPARVLAECEAKRRIVELHPEIISICQGCGDAYPCRTLLALVQVYADHAEFDPSWAL